MIDNLLLNYIITYAKKSDIILDAGAGDLQYTRYLNNMNYSVLPIDVLIPKDIKNTSFIQASIENLPFDDCTFDFIYSLSVVEFAKDNQKAIDEFYRVLKVGSFCIFTVPSSISVFRLLMVLENYFKINPYTNRLLKLYPEYNQKNRYYTNKQIKKLLKKFKIIELSGYGLNFIPRAFSFFYKFVFRRDVVTNFDSNNIIMYESSKSYKNKFLSEICYHKVIICKKVDE